jgi:hypothetical protein
MNRQKFISFCSALTVLFFSANGLAKSNDFSVKPTVPSSKIKKTVPPSAPTPVPAPVSVQPSKPTKAVPASVGSTPAPKPTVPVATPKLTVPKPGVVNVKPTTIPASLPSSVGRTGLPQARVPADFGKSVQIPGSLGGGVGQTNSIGGLLPAGHTTPVAGFGKTSGAAAFGKGIGQQDGVGSIRDKFSDPVIKIGAGAQRQGQEEETGSVVYGKYTFDDVPASDVEDIRAGIGNGFSDDDIALLYGEYLTEIDEGTSSGDSHTGDTATQPSPSGKQGAQGDEERIVDEGPSDTTPDGRHIDPDRMKSMFSGSPGIRFAPGEGEDGGDGPVDPGRIGEIQSQKNQVHTFEGAVPDSLNFGDLGKQAQETIKAGGVPVRSD